MLIQKCESGTYKWMDSINASYKWINGQEDEWIDRAGSISH